MKLSVITINYNNANGLERTAQSVIKQTCSDFEWIIIDGGSTDGSKLLIEKYKSYLTYSVSEPDKGIYNAMNKGIDVATGDYCLFLNSGDSFYSSTVVEELYQKISSDCQYTFLIGNINIIDVNGRSHLHCDIPENVTGFYLYQGGVFPHQSTLTSSTFLKKYHYKENYKIVSDWLFTVEMLLLKNATLKRVDVIIANYDLDGISFKNYQLAFEERKNGFAEIMGIRTRDDYERLCYGSSLLERIMHKVEKYPVLYKFMTLYNLPIGVIYKIINIFFRR